MSYFELYLEESVRCLRFGTGTLDSVRGRGRSYPCVCCYAVTSKYSGEPTVRQGLTAWGDTENSFIALEVDPLVDQGVPLKFYSDANALVSLARDYVTDDRKISASVRWIASTLSEGYLHFIDEDDAWMLFTGAASQSEIYMELHGTSDEITILLKQD